LNKIAYFDGVNKHKVKFLREENVDQGGSSVQFESVVIGESQETDKFIWVCGDD
jgi:hypothetical protein